MTSAQAALPLPAGRPGPLHGLAATLRVVADRLVQSCLARGGQARDLAPSWVGPASLAAEAELYGAQVGSHALSGALASAALVVRDYAGLLDTTIGEIGQLQRSWEHAETRHRRLASLAAAQGGAPLTGPTVAELDLEVAQERARLRGRHTRLMAALAEAGTIAAAALRVCRATPLAGPPPGGSSSDGWYGSLAAALPMSVHAARSAAGMTAVAGALSGTPPLREWSTDDIDGLLRLDTSDPAIAGALVETVGIDGLTRLATRMTKADPNDPDACERARVALGRLGTALRVALDPGAWADDPRWLVRVQDTTARWRAAVSEPRATTDFAIGLPVLTVQAHALLLQASRDRATSPVPADVLSTLAAAAAAAEADGAIWATVPGSDPMGVIVAELRRDTGEAWRVLLRDVAPGVSLVGYLTERRGRFLADEMAARAVAVDLDRLMADVAHRTDRPSLRLTAEFLSSLATATVATEDGSEAALQMSRYLTTFRPSLAEVLLAHPSFLDSAIHAPIAVDGDTLAGLKVWDPTIAGQAHRESATSMAFDPSSPAFASRVWLVEDGAPGAPGASGASATLQADDVTTVRSLVGLLGVAIAEHPTLDGQGVALAPVLARATLAHEAILVASVRSHDIASATEAAGRIGSVYGFGTTAAGLVQSDRAATLDTQIETQRAVIETVTNAIRLPAKLQATPVGVIAGAAFDWLLSRDPATVDPALRVHAVHDATVEQAAYAAATRMELRLRAWDAVSESRCWSEAAGPDAWLRRHPGPDFTDGAGRPLPLAAMTSDQRMRMLQWATSIPEYGRIDAAITAGFSAGQELATAATKPAVHLKQLADLGKAQP